MRTGGVAGGPVMRPLRVCPDSALARVRVVFFDIDDTFSGGARDRGASHCARESRIVPEAYDALWRLKRAGVGVVPVTGRPAGWCDLIARMWPVDAVVGENGAFYAYVTPQAGSRSGAGAKAPGPMRFVKRYLEAKGVRERNARRLVELRRAVARAFPRARTPSDQPFREFDLAIDWCEDERRWSQSEVTRLLDLCRARGAQAKLSSIHVNAWFGRYDKLACVRRVLSRVFLLDPYEDLGRVVYIGDSPNDEPFFEKLPLTVGVANVREFLPRMRAHPAFITRAESGPGFAELASRILKARRCR